MVKHILSQLSTMIEGWGFDQKDIETDGTIDMDKVKWTDLKKPKKAFVTYSDSSRPFDVIHYDLALKTNYIPLRIPLGGGTSGFKEITVCTVFETKPEHLFGTEEFREPIYGYLDTSHTEENFVSDLNQYLEKIFGKKNRIDDHKNLASAAHATKLMLQWLKMKDKDGNSYNDHFMTAGENNKVPFPKAKDPAVEAELIKIKDNAKKEQAKNNLKDWTIDFKNDAEDLMSAYDDYLDIAKKYYPDLSKKSQIYAALLTGDKSISHAAKINVTKSLKHPTSPEESKAAEKFIEVVSDYSQEFEEIKGKNFDFILPLGSSSGFNQQLCNQLQTKYFPNAKVISVPKRSLKVYMSDPTRPKISIDIAALERHIKATAEQNIDELLSKYTDSEAKSLKLTGKPNAMFGQGNNIDFVVRRRISKDDYIINPTTGKAYIKDQVRKSLETQFNPSMNNDITIELCSEDKSDTKSKEVCIRYKNAFDVERLKYNQIYNDYVNSRMTAMSGNVQTYIDNYYKQSISTRSGARPPKFDIKFIPENFRKFVDIFDITNLLQSRGKMSLLVVDDNLVSGGTVLNTYKLFQQAYPDAEVIFFIPLKVN